MKKEKKPHGVQLLLRAVVKDPDGKILSDTGRKPAKSFVIQFLEFVCAMLSATTTDATDIAGAEQEIYFSPALLENHIQIDGGVNDDTIGIVVGTGDTAETNIDIALETQLTEGVGLGNITHGAQVVGTAEVVGTNVDLVLNRAFTNNTGAAITVEEAGLYSFTDTLSHCLIRDVLGVPVEVPDMCSLTIYYTVRTTV